MPETDGSLPEADGSSPEADGSLPEADGSLPEADGSLPEAEGSSPEAGGAGLTAWRAGWYTLAVVVLLLDQASKWLASAELTYAMPEPVFTWFNLTLHHNQGAAFSFLSSAGGWQRWLFAVLAVLVSVLLVVWLRQLSRRQWPLALGLALVLGGALGNLLDRLRLGYVVDFVSVHYRDWYFPTFNVADAAISVGAALIVLDSLFGAHDDPDEVDEVTDP